MLPTNRSLPRHRPVNIVGWWIIILCQARNFWQKGLLMNPTPETNPSSAPFGPQEERSHSLVLISGLVTTVLTLLGIYVLDARTDFHIMGLYANYILPVGAILVGVAASSGCLNEEREPKEGARRDESHCVARQPGKAQSRLHLRCFLICHEHSPEIGFRLAAPGGWPRKLVWLARIRISLQAEMGKLLELAES